MKKHSMNVIFAIVISIVTILLLNYCSSRKKAVQKVQLPEPVAVTDSVFIGAEVNDGKHYGTAIINSSLAGYEPKGAYPWECSVCIYIENMTDDRLPVESEFEPLYKTEDKIDSLVNGDLKPVNAIYVGHTLIDGTMLCLWRVRDAEAAYKAITEFSNSEKYLRPFSYIIEHDPQWERTSVLYKGIGLEL